MTMWRGVVPAFAAFTLIASEAAVSQTNTTDAFVKGTTDFLLDRANDNYIYIFQKKLEANPLLQKYLPETLRIVKAGDIQSLITHKDLWRDALRRDIVGDGDRLLTRARDEWKGYLDTLCTKSDKGSTDAGRKELDDLCDVAHAQLDAKAADFLVKKQQALINKVCTAEFASKNKDNKDSCDKAGSKVSDFQKGLEDARKRLAEAQARLVDARKLVSGSQNPRAVVYFSAPGATSALNDLTRDLDGIKPEACTDVDVGRYTGCVIEILYILEAVAHADYVVNCYMFGNLCSNANRDGKNANVAEDDDFKDFRRYALFFAQLADAVDTNDRGKVNALLKSVTIPAVSFGIKREPHATRVLVTAYVGGGWSWKTSNPHEQVWGLVAPVGVEISQARDSGNSLSLLVSPLDFAYPLTLKLKNTDATVKGSDVVVPSAYVFYGWKNYPVAAGLGYSRGRSIDNPDQRVGRILIVVAFDMPLFRLH